MEMLWLWVGVGVSAAVWFAVIVTQWSRRGRTARAAETASPRTRTERWVMVLLGLAWSYGFFPNMITTFQNGRSRVEVDKVLGPVPAAQLTLKVIFAAFVALAVILLLSTLKAKVPARHWLLFVMLTPFVFTSFSAMLNGDKFSLDTVIYPLTVLVMWRTQVPIRTLVVIGWITGLASAASFGLGAAVPLVGTTLPPIVGDKAFWPTLLAGPYAHPNVLGLALSLGIPFILLIKQRWIQIIGVGLAFLSVLWSGNRCSILAAAVCIAIYAYTSFRPTGKLLPAVAAVAGAALVVVTPLTSTSADDYSYRGQIWMSSLEYWQDSPILGRGPRFYGDIAQYSNDLGLTAFSGHNALIHLLTTGGLLLVASVLLLYVVAFRRANGMPRHLRPIMLAALIGLIFNGWLQNTITYTDLTELAYIGWIPLAVMLFSPEAAHAEPRLDPTAASLHKHRVRTRRAVVHSP